MASNSSSSSCGSARYIRLRKGTLQEYVEGRTQGYLLRLEVVDACGIDPAIFVFQREPQANGLFADNFVNVASPADIAEYPLDEPTACVAFYRKTVVDLVFRSLDLLASALADLERDVAELVRTYNLLDNVAEEIIIIDG